MSSGYVIFLASARRRRLPAVAGADRPGFRLGRAARASCCGASSREIDAVDAQREVASLLREKYLRELSPLARRLEDSPHMEALGRLIEQSGRHDPGTPAGGIAVLCAAVATTLAMIFTDSPVLDAARTHRAAARRHSCTSPASGCARLEKFEEQLPDAVDVMKRALRAGHPFNACLKLVAEDMDDPIAREFEHDLRRRQLRQRPAPRAARPAAAGAELEPDGGRDGRADAEGDRRQPRRDLRAHLAGDPQPFPVRPPGAHAVGRGPPVGLDPDAGADHPVRRALDHDAVLPAAAARKSRRARRCWSLPSS